MKLRAIGQIIVGLLLFGVLLALRNRVDNVYLRAAVSACGFGFLVVAILAAKTSSRPQQNSSAKLR